MSPASLPRPPNRAPHRRSLRATLREKRGATAMMFAASALTLFGFAALATEGGNWYYTHRNARSAADMGALAGATAYFTAASTLPTATKQNTARASAQAATVLNGFTNGGPRTTVTVNVPPVLPANPTAQQLLNANSPGAVEVIVEQRQPTFIAGMMLGQDQVAVRARAVALTVDMVPACVLATKTSDIALDLLGTADLTAPHCVLHSNSSSSGGVRVGNNFASTVEALGISSNARCAQSCIGIAGVTGGAGKTNAGILVNPYAEFQAAIVAFTNGKTNGSVSGNTASTITVTNSSASNQANANTFASAVTALTGITVLYGPNTNTNLSLGNNVTLTLPPNRTYVFWNAGIQLNNGTLNCTGCTFIFTGPGGAAGQVVQTGGVFHLSSALTPGVPPAPLPAALTRQAVVGIAIYRDERGANGGGIEVQINGGSDSFVVGAIVAATSDVRFNGNSETAMACSVVIGETVQMNGTGFMSVDACEANGVKTPRVQIVRLAE